VLVGLQKNKPLVVLYKPVLPEGQAGEPWRAVSPVGEVDFDDVRRVPGAVVAQSPGNRWEGWSVEAAIPLSAIDWKPVDNTRLKADWGLLRTGPDGHEVLERIYWSNQATAITMDLPSEARLSPQLWGFARVHDSRRPSSEDRFESEEVTGKPKPKDKALKGDVDDILESLEP